ncbi:M15 family metallopeptidase [Paenibacillus hexagrammi]|uniref:M15 family metallopeptidase n=1 Tax=Paenibacillus hexagrammi TaxID=2908839 RepID=A0ABY3SKV0_9BACL|nr:M15 family metallopeptidase [Paenibacillus sp. YPD9-1]UJF34679.1 M15 family metallopeptidase [Paenibacillus sp. YPD9-1]
MNMYVKGAIAVIAALVICTGCGGNKEGAAPSPSPSSGQTEASPMTKSASDASKSSPSAESTAASSTKPGASVKPTATAKATSSPSSHSNTGAKNDAVQVVAKPESITVLVNKQNSLPDSYEPADLVYPDVPFVFKEKIEKRKMRKEAASALEKLFAGAEKDGIYLAGVSAYRSYATQKSVFQRYVAKDGEEKAKTYSAVPGTSEHETGLAIDVSGSDGKCAAEDCFGGTKEAKWLEQHAAEYGFIIRYPKGKDAITGYQYEPWHIRFVGTNIAKEIHDKGITLEEYFNAVPVTKQ